MTIFEYFMVLLSVVLSLALAQLITGVGELVRARGKVRWSVTYLLWLVVTFAMIIDYWASLWLVRGIPSWTLVALVFLLLPAAMMFLSILWLLPRHIGDEPIDLAEHLLSERRLFLGALIAYFVCGGVTNVLILPPGEFDFANFAILPVALMIAGSAWWSPRTWVQRAAPMVMLALLAAYFSVYFTTIG
jgi:hypothetical protein